MASYQKETKKLVKDAQERGWRAEPTTDGYQLKHEDGVSIVTIHKTPSKPSSIRHAKALMEKVEREWAAKQRAGP